jgi:hypothetical protein
MPFSVQEADRIGQNYIITPVEGFGWTYITISNSPKLVKPPSPFEMVLRNAILSDGADFLEPIAHLKKVPSVLALIGQVNLSIESLQVKWVSVIPRTDDLVDVRQRHVTCNLLFSPEKMHQTGAPFGDPCFLLPTEKHHIRGFGILSLA